MAKEMILDTDVLLRLFIRDVEHQYQSSLELFKKSEEGAVKLNISILVIAEIINILENYYKLERSAYADKLIKLINMKNIGVIELSKVNLNLVLDKYFKGNMDFLGSHLLFMSKFQNKEIFTFDKALERQAIKS
jgi:predicted nucleic-acid-binding protein